MWAPVKDKKGGSIFHWENMKLVKPGDLIFNYRKGMIVGFCVAETSSYGAPQPEEFSTDADWEEEGRMVDCDYTVLESPVSIKSIYTEIESLLPQKYSPLSKPIEGDQIKANQGYLYKCPQELGTRLLQIIGEEHMIIEESDNQEFLELEYKIPDSTSRKGLVTSRIGQGNYRRGVLRRWRNRCAVTGFQGTEILIASHIVPWKDANDKERLDVNNGILLSPTYDALFDKHLISFGDDGKIILSISLRRHDYQNLGITGDERIESLTLENLEYLRRHRKLLRNI